MHTDNAVPLDTLLAHRPWIRALARSLVRDPSVVDDIEQEVFVAAMNVPKIETSLRGWLRSVVKNAVLQRHRGESRRSAREQSAMPPRGSRTPEDIVAEADSHRHVVEAVMNLDEPYRKTVLVRYFEGLSLQETAERLGIPRETVKTRMRRAHAMLRERLRREHGDERRGVPAVVVPIVGGPDVVAKILGRIPGSVAGARPWVPIAMAAGMFAAASLVGFSVHASTGDGDAGVLFAVPSTDDDDDEVGDVGREPPPAVDADERRRVGVDAATEDEPAPPPEKAAPPPLDHFVVRDLFTRDPVPHLALDVTRDSVASIAVSDASGRVDSTPVGLTKIESGDAIWSVPGAPRVSALVDGVLWVHRTAQLDVTIVDADPHRELSLGSVEVIYLVESVIGGTGKGPGSFHFNTRTGLDLDQGRTAVTADGRARMTVPVVRGLRVSGVAAGWRTASSAVRFDTALRAEPVTLELTSGVSFDGRVRNAKGLPVPGVKILLTTARHIDASEVDVAALRAEGGGGVGLIGSAKKGFDVSWQSRVAMNARGIFQGRVTADGDVLLIVTAKGYVPKRVALGRLAADLHKIEVVLERPDPELRTLIAVGGRPVKGTRVLFHDVTGNPQVSTYVQTDPDGTFPTQMLIEGHRYTVDVRVPGDAPHESRLVTWDGRKTIDVEELSQDWEGDDK